MNATLTHSRRIPVKPVNMSDRSITIPVKSALCALHDVEKLQDDGLEDNTCDDSEETVESSSGGHTKANNNSCVTGVDQNDDSSLEMSESILTCS